MNEKQTTLHGGVALSKSERKKQKKEFVERLMSLFRPKLVMPGYTDIPIPAKVEQRILIERCIAVKTGEKLATETEAMWYLSTASLVAPLDRDGYNIFMYLTRRFLKATGQELPDFLQENIVLDEYTAEPAFFRLRQWIYKKGMEAMDKRGDDV